MSFLFFICFNFLKKKLFLFFFGFLFFMGFLGFFVFYGFSSFFCDFFVCEFDVFTLFGDFTFFCSSLLALVSSLNDLLLLLHELCLIFTCENAGSLANMLGLGVLSNLPEPRVTVDEFYLLFGFDLLEKDLASSFLEGVDVGDGLEMDVADEE